MRSLRLGVWKSTLHDFYLYSLFLSSLLSSFFWPIGDRMYAKWVYLCLVFTLFHLQAIVAYTKTIEVCVDLVVRSFVRLFDSVACIVSFFITHWHILVCTKHTHTSKRNRIHFLGWFNMLRFVRFELAARSELRNASYDMNAVCMDRQHAATHSVYTPYTFVWFLSHLSIQLMLILCWGRIVNVRANSVHKFIHSNHTENSHSHRFSI